jgi:hypothetical protein
MSGSSAAQLVPHVRRVAAGGIVVTKRLDLDVGARLVPGGDLDPPRRQAEAQGQ